METIQTVTIFRTWVEIAAALKTDAERGKLYHAICEYALYGKEPELDGALAAFFTLMRPTIDKSNKRKAAQQKGVQTRTQYKLQNNSQTDLQNDLQNNSQTDLQNGITRVRKTGTGTEKKTVPKGTAKEKISFAILLPDHLQCSDVDVKWKEWEEFRRKKGKPISEAAARKQMQMLSLLSREEAIAAIDNSIANDYQGLFPPKTKNRPPAAGKDYSGL